jgi:hypothetical protein
MSEHAKEVTGEIVPFDAKNLKVFDPFEAELAELEEQNDKLKFDYRSPKGNREARSHIHNLRKSKAAVERTRKDAKDEALKYGKAVDARAKGIVGRLEDMIKVHKEPLDRLEQEEEARVAGHKEKIEELKRTINAFPDESSKRLRDRLKFLTDFTIDESWDEFEEQAMEIATQGLETLKQRLLAAEKAEAEAAELEALRKEKAERDRKDAEEKAAREAAEKAEREAKERKEREDRIAKEAAEYAEKAARAAQKKAEREAEEAKKRAKEAEQRAKDKAEREAREKAEAEEAARQKREADKKLRATVRSAITKNMVAEIKLSLKNTDQCAVPEIVETLINAIEEGNIPYLKIEY